MKLTTLLLMVLLLAGCIDNPLTESKEEKALSSLEKELTEYATSLTGNRDIKSYLQTKYPEIYADDSVEILSFGSEPYKHHIFIVMEKGIKIMLTTPCVGLSCGVKRDDVILYTKNKEKIKDVIRQYVAQSNKAAANSSGKVFFDGKMIGEVKRIPVEGFKDINCSNFSKKPHRELIYIEPLAKNATKKEILEYMEKVKVTSRTNSASIIFNQKAYYCWQENYVQSIYNLANEVRDKNISMDALE